MAKLKVSVATFNEIAGLLEQSGTKLAPGVSITLDKDTALIPPIDYRLATIRRDCMIEAIKTFLPDTQSTIDIINRANDIFEFVINGKVNKIEENNKWA